MTQRRRRRITTTRDAPDYAGGHLKIKGKLLDVE